MAFPGQTPGMEEQMHSLQMPSHSIFMKVDNELPYSQTTDTSASVTLSESGVLWHPSDISLGPIKAFHTVAKDKSKKKEHEQEPSVVTDKQLVTLLQHLHDAGVLKEVDVRVSENPVVQLAFVQ
ncbi:hypothetical protein C0995_012233, partial [Termitomyces sp. Mi166